MKKTNKIDQEFRIKTQLVIDIMGWKSPVLANDAPQWVWEIADVLYWEGWRKGGKK
jgi:hypothetical protein